MCVIYAVQTELPPDAELKRGSETNEDGAGVAWLHDGLIHWKKDLGDWQKVLKFIKEMDLKPPYAIHFRSASVGGKSTSLAHPFPIGKGTPTWVEGTAGQVLFHNGHLGEWGELALRAGLASKEQFPLGAWSDSRALAWLVHLKGEGILPFIIGQSRVLLFNAEADTREGVDYDPGEDHFSYYGSGWIHNKGGWSQSVDTYDRWARTPGRWNYMEDTEQKGLALAKSSASSSCSSSTAHSSSPYVWTIEDLTTILADLKKEQEDAKLASAVQ